MTRLSLRRPPDLEARGSKKGFCEITLQGPAFREKFCDLKPQRVFEATIFAVTDYINTLRTGDANLRFLRFCITTVKDE
jgi:hypothetical protein